MGASRGFASDNNSGVHPDVLAAIERANDCHAVAYGDDEVTAAATRTLKDHFGDEAEVFFVLTGTGANVLAIDAVTRPHHSVVCAETAHVYVDECGAPERYTGCKLLPIATGDGKLRPEDVEGCLGSVGFEHHSQPRVVSVSQATELGTVYTADELAALAEHAHANGLILHVDGARIANAAAALGAGLGRFTRDVGVDVLSFGGTKNGMLLGEAVVFFDPSLAEGFKYLRKQGMQLFSKMRFLAAQFVAMYEGDLWLANATHANEMARSLAEGLATLPGVEITQEVEANGVFARVPEEAVPTLLEHSFFYVWDDKESVVRLMASFDTTPDDVDAFVAAAAAVLEGRR